MQENCTTISWSSMRTTLAPESSQISRQLRVDSLPLRLCCHCTCTNRACPACRIRASWQPCIESACFLFGFEWPLRPLTLFAMPLCHPLLSREKARQHNASGGRCCCGISPDRRSCLRGRPDIRRPARRGREAGHRGGSAPLVAVPVTRRPRIGQRSDSRSR